MALMMASRHPNQAQCDKQQPDLCLWTKSATRTLIDHITQNVIELPNVNAQMSGWWLFRTVTKLNTHHHRLALDKWAALMVAGRHPILVWWDKQLPDLCLWTKSATVTLIDHITKNGIKLPIPYVW
jgi:hypothetical protein